MEMPRMAGTSSIDFKVGLQPVKAGFELLIVVVSKNGGNLKPGTCREILGPPTALWWTGLGTPSTLGGPYSIDTVSI